MPKLAVYTFGVLREPWGSPGNESFEAAARDVFRSAEGAEGFLELHEDDGSVPPWVDGAERARAAATLTVWRSLEDVFAFTYRADHGSAFRRRRDWFPEAPHPGYVLWWLDDHALASCREAVGRLERLHERGPTAEAFTFRVPFDALGRPLRSIASRGRSGS